MRIISIIIIIFFSVELISLDKTTYYSYGVEFDSSVFKVNHSDEDSVRLIISYRLLYDVLNFEEIYEKDNKNLYSSDVDIEIVFTDDGGIIRNRSNIKDTIYAKSFEETNSKIIYHKGFFDINLKNSDYRIDLTVIDRNKKKYSTSVPVKKIIKDNIFKNSDLMFYRSNALSELFGLSNYITENGFMFDNNQVSILVNVDKIGADYFYEMEYLRNKQEDFIYNYWSNSKIIFDNKVEKLNNKNIIFQNTKSELNFDIVNGESNFIRINLPLEKILPGEYKITITNEDKDTIQRYFNVNWESKPLSLDRISYAVDRMYYILADEEYEKLSNSDNIEKDFMEYWKKLDPTYDTPYNEAMVQYFSRVDYSFFNFSTLAEKDGAKTDRGKIFVLYGPPTKIIDKNIDGKKGYEWEYVSLDKKFIFQTVSSGFIKLIEIKE